MLVERFVRAVCDDGLDVGSILVITYTKRAAGELRSRIRARLLELDRGDLARELDGAWISTIHGFCNRLLKTYPLAAGTRSALSRARRRAGLGVARRGVRGRARGVLRRRASRSGSACLRRTARRGCAACSPVSSRRCAPPAASSCWSSASGRACPTPSSGWKTPRAVSSTTRPQPRRSAPQLRRALEVLESDSSPERLLDLDGLKARGERAASYDEARRAVEQAALDEAAAHDRGLLEELLAGFAARVPGREGPRVGARLRGSPAASARPASRERGHPSARAVALPLDHGRRVPGHEPAPVRADRCARRAHGRVLRRRRVPVDLRLPPRGRQRLPRAAGCVTAGPAADAELSLAARGARRRRTSSSRASSARNSSRSTRPATFRTPSSALRRSCSSPTSRRTPVPTCTGGVRRRSTSRSA